MAIKSGSAVEFQYQGSSTAAVVVGFQARRGCGYAVTVEFDGAGNKASSAGMEFLADQIVDDPRFDPAIPTTVCSAPVSEAHRAIAAEFDIVLVEN